MYSNRNNINKNETSITSIKTYKQSRFNIEVSHNSNINKISKIEDLCKPPGYMCIIIEYLKELIFAEVDIERSNRHQFTEQEEINNEACYFSFRHIIHESIRLEHIARHIENSQVAKYAY